MKVKLADRLHRRTPYLVGRATNDPGSATSSCSKGLELYGKAKIGQAFD
jgi:hypothetical protein